MFTAFETDGCTQHNDSTTVEKRTSFKILHGHTGIEKVMLVWVSIYQH
jgi:hypothetical protein